jgi:hypothetical protein
VALQDTLATDPNSKTYKKALAEKKRAILEKALDRLPDSEELMVAYMNLNESVWEYVYFFMYP